MLDTTYKIYAQDGWIELTVTRNSSTIRFMDRFGEIVNWVSDEWEEDPHVVVVAILSSIGILMTRGGSALRETVSNPPTADAEKREMHKIIVGGQEIEHELRKLISFRREIKFLSESEEEFIDPPAYELLFKSMGRVIELMFHDRWGPSKS